MRKNWVASITAVLLLPFCMTGCLFGPDSGGSAMIDPPPKDAQKKAEEGGDGKEQSKDEEKEATADQNSLELYFLTEAGYVVPYTLNIPKVAGVAKEALGYMVKEGPEKEMLPKGFSGILPKGTKVKGLDIKSGTATVDFSKEFLAYDKGLEEQILAAVTWTLTGFDAVKKVDIKVSGKPLEAMPKGKSPAQNLTRAQGINLELAKGIDASQSMPVTIYFLGQTAENEVYYVPVTRMINRGDNKAEAALKELVRGPLQGSTLVNALAETTKVNKVKIEGDTAVADFGSQLLQYSDEKQASQDAMATIVLSITENTAAKKVKVTVDGKVEANASQKGFVEPATRPAKINPGSL